MRVGCFWLLSRNIDTFTFAAFPTRARPWDSALVAPFDFLADGNPEIDLKISGNVRTIPSLDFVKHRDGCADNINPLLGQELAQSAISHR